MSLKQGAEKEKYVLLIDSSAIAYAAFHTTGNLSYKGQPTGTIYGFLQKFYDILNTFGRRSYYIFCWDSLKNYRKEVFPGYKISREKKRLNETYEEKMARQDMYSQINALPQILQDMGFKNHLKAEGYEADDLIAAVARGGIVKAKYDLKYVIVGIDSDLYQCLRPNDKCRLLSLRQDRGYITAEDWAGLNGFTVDKIPLWKALAGDTSDDIPGCKQIGKARAAQWIKNPNGLKPTYQEIITEFQKTELYDIFLKITTLPFSYDEDPLKVEPFKPKLWNGDDSGMRAVKLEYGMENLTLPYVGDI